MRFVVFDVETPNRRNNRISAIGITIIENNEIVDNFYTLVNPETNFDYFNTALTGISGDMVRYSPTFPDVWQQIEPIMENSILVAHNAVFDLSVLRSCFKDYNILWKNTTPYLCTVQIGRKILPNISHRLNDLSDYYKIKLNHHKADSDSNACAEILLNYIKSGTDVNRFLKTFDFTK